MTDPIFILRGVCGSTAHDLSHEGSDLDHHGVISYPTASFWSLSKPSESLVGHEPEDYAYHELEKFLKLASKSNPQVLELLWLDQYEEMEYFWGQRLIDIRSAFASSNLVFHAYAGYADSQFKKLEARGVTYAHDFPNEKMHKLSALQIARLLRDRQLSTGQEESRLPRLSGEEGKVGTRSGPNEEPSSSESLRGEEQGKAGGILSASELWHNSGTVRGDAPFSDGEMPNLRRTSAGSGSLTRDGGDSGSALSEVQHGLGAVRGLGGSATESDLLLSHRLHIFKSMKHMFRLLEQGQQLYTTGILSVKVEDRDWYLNVLPDMTMDQITQEFNLRLAAFKASEYVLPTAPDMDAVNSFLYNYRQAHVQ